ncbi:MAG: hypothetical protein ACRDT6_28540 [Micromonosporaceae bacterium]
MTNAPRHPSENQTHLAESSLDGGLGNTVLVLYTIGGLVLAVVSLLPGKSPLWRIGGVILGLVVAGWASYVLLFGGWIIINYYVALLPFILAGKQVWDWFQSRRAQPAS